jgi:hypothetical protein
MPETTAPLYVEGGVERPQWSNGSSFSAYNTRRISVGDEIKAEDTNQLREFIELFYAHSHNYTDSIGSC